MKMNDNTELTEEQIEEALEFKREMERIEREEPRYDVEYDVSSSNERDMVMEAHGRLNDDLDGQNHVPINTTVEDRGSVMITVAVNEKKSAFENCEAVWLVDSRSRHHLWCVKKFDTEDTEPVLPDDDGIEEFERIEAVGKEC